MVCPIVKDIFFLSQKAEPAGKADLQTAQNLLDTLKAHETECVGLAANMIGVQKAIIAVHMGFADVAMLNPSVTRKSGAFETEEGCLSLVGTRKCTRYQEIEVAYQDMQLRWQKRKFSGWTAQIIQHEIDHLNGIVI